MPRSISLLPLLLTPTLAFAQTTTGTVAMPEDGGALPRAEMPGARPDSAPGATDEGQPPLDPPATPLPTGGSPLRLEWAGYVRVIGELVQDDDSFLAIGRNDGFRLANVRLGLRASWGENLYGYVSLDAAVAQATDVDDSNAEMAVGVRDAYLAYVFGRAATIQLGRFKPPYDLEELAATESRIIIDEAIESRGVLRTQGIEAIGMRPGRQIGLMIHSPRVGLDDRGLDLGYALAITNGNTGDRVFNDNDHFAGFARVSLLYSNVLAINAAGFIDTRTSGVQPDLFEDRVIGAEGSLVLDIEGFRIEGQFLFQHDDPITAGTPAFDAFGWHAQWSYRIWGFEPAYRFAWFEPNTNAELDQVNEHTVALSYYVDPMPLRLSLNGTFAFEEREVDNHRLALLVQYTF